LSLHHTVINFIVFSKLLNIVISLHHTVSDYFTLQALKITFLDITNVSRHE